MLLSPSKKGTQQKETLQTTHRHLRAQTREQFEKKLEQLEDQLEEHAQDAAVHGEVEKVKETGGGGQAPAAVHKGQVG